MRFSSGWRGFVELGLLLLAVAVFFPFYWVYDKLRIESPEREPED
jgi:hypothetical protein